MYCDEKLNTRLASRRGASVEIQIDQIGTRRGNVIDFNESYIILKDADKEVYFDWLYIISIQFL